MAAMTVLPAWSALLEEAVSKPGIISDAYSRFWNYSTGNQLLALFQCVARDIPPGPINTFMAWKALGRNVKKGEKAITLCMPVTARRRQKAEAVLAPSSPAAGSTTDTAENREEVMTLFIHRPRWFVLAQTEGLDYTPPALPEWTECSALKSLGIERVPFNHLDGNVQGYAALRQVAVSPIAFTPHRTLFHELGHVVLGHTGEGGNLVDGQERTPRDLREAEAECVALICCESLGLSGAEFSRGYIQHWLRGQPIPPRSAQRIFKAADEVLKAGWPKRQQGGV